MPGYAGVWNAVLECLDRTEASGKAVLRWGIVNSTGNEALLEIATITGGSRQTKSAIPMHVAASGFNVALVIPTGVGAAIGGFIGDAGPVAKALEIVADSVIVHPNVVNAADFYAGGSRSLYVDGLTLDRFFEGEV